MEPASSETPGALPPQTPKPRQRRWLPRVRFSLLTLLLGALLCGSAGTLWRNWEPWRLQSTVHYSAWSDNTFCFSISRDAHRALLNTAERLRILDLESGADIVVFQNTPPDHPEQITEFSMTVGAMISPDSRRFVIEGVKVIGWKGPENAMKVTYDMRVRDLENGAERVLVTAQPEKIGYMVYSSNGERLITRIGLQQAQVWELKSGKKLAILSGHTGTIWSTAFSPDGRQIVTTSDDQTVRVWNAETGVELAKLIDGQQKVTDAKYSADGAKILASCESEVYIWDTASGAQLSVLGVPASEILIVSFSPDGRRVVAATRDGSVRTWDVNSGKQLKAWNLEGFTPFRATLSLDCRKISIDGEDCSLSIWDTESGVRLALLEPGVPKEKMGYGGPFVFSELSSDGHTVVRATLNTISTWVLQRSEASRGVAWLPEFWLAVALAGVFGWSIWRDRRILKIS